MKPHRITAIAISLLLTACAIPGKKLGVDISGVNYSDRPITYLLNAAGDSASGGAEPLDPFAAGGAMCCFSLPETWTPGIKIRIEILDTHRNSEKDDIVELPPYLDGKPGRVWAVYYQDGSVDVFSSEYGPPHKKWPGKVKGWPVPTIEYRRKLWERDLADIKHSVHAAESLIKEMENDPERSLQRHWEHDKKYSWKAIERFSGPTDPAYGKFVMQSNIEFLQSAQERLDDWMKKRP